MSVRTLGPACLALLPLVTAQAGCTRGGAPASAASERPPIAAPAAARGAATKGSGKATAPVAPGARKPAESPLGTNLDSIKDWSNEWSFVDQFKASRAWISGSEGAWDDGRKLDLDEHGWVRSLAPGQLARTVLLWDGVEAPAGRYVVLYEGEGRIDYGHGALVVRGRPKDGTTRDTIRLDPRRGGLALAITETNPKNPLRKIRVLMPGGVCEADPFAACDEAKPCRSGACLPFEQTHESQPFHPVFLERTRTYGALRFMDWMATNNSEQRRWAERPKPSDARFSDKGVPVEVMVDLANRLDQDAWFTMPHLADDDYVGRFAAYVRDHLEPGRKAYVEHSNEVWNGIFKQSAHALAAGKAARLPGDDFQMQLRHHARRSAQIFRIWEKTFGGRERLVRVLGAQVSNAWASDVMLSFEGTKAVTDALAVAPYFGGGYGDDPKLRARVPKLSVAQLMTELRDTSLPQTLGWVKEQAAVARKHGVALVAYEGGQHLVLVGDVNDDVANRLFDAANRDPRMKGLYLDLLRGWRDSGGGLFVNFVNCAKWGKWGRWGALESLMQARAESPKYDALQTFIETTPRWF